MRQYPSKIFSLFLLTIILTLGGVQALLAEPEPATDLVGLWAAQRDFTPEVRGDLRIYENDGNWRAEIGGFSVKVMAEENNLSFEIPGDRGAFRGSIQGKNIKGHWVQPRTQSNFSPYASPVYLVPMGPGRWRGRVRQLNDTLHFYLMVEEKDGGKISAFMRNPEANIGRFYKIDQILQDGDSVQFIDAGGRVRLEGTMNQDRGQLSIYFPYNGGTYDFVRADDDPASRFYPRPKTDGPYHYSQPEDGEGWESATLEDTGMAVGPIEEMIQMIIDTPMDGLEAPYVHGFLVARGGKLVVEEYFHGFSKDIPHGTRSASKTVTATLAGIAVSQGRLSLDTPVYQTMYGENMPEGLDQRATRMVLENLITMTPGLACDDFSQESPGNEDTMQNQDEQPDWFLFTLELEMLYEPGEHAAYCSGSQNLAGGVVARATGEWLPDFYHDQFAAPLKMGLYHMNLSPTGEGYGGGGLLIKPRDFLKLGQVYLDDGKWKGQQIVSQDWAQKGTEAINDIGKEGYGYGWWIFNYPFEGREIKAYYAGGNGGQYVIVVPELDLNIVIFAGNYNQRVMHKTKCEYVRDYVLRAISEGEAD
ncbi:MAG: serine hydrolase domain-containing protein [Alphaproteobacteria bacterium]